jgi:hypothetical protein
MSFSSHFNKYYSFLCSCVGVAIATCRALLECSYLSSSLSSEISLGLSNRKFMTQLAWICLKLPYKVIFFELS